MCKRQEARVPAADEAHECSQHEPSSPAAAGRKHRAPGEPAGDRKQLTKLAGVRVVKKYESGI